MADKAALRLTTANRVYLIVALFVVIIAGLVFLIQVQMNTMVAIRVYVGGGGLWAKAQKDAILSLEHYAISHDEADYQAYLRAIQVTLSDKEARIELQKPRPNLEIVRAALLQGRLHPQDIEYVIHFSRRFQHTEYVSEVISHWTEADRLVAELDGVAKALRQEITTGHSDPAAIPSLHTRLDTINAQVSKQEDLFSSTLAEASRWAHARSRQLTYAIAALFVVLGVMLSWTIIIRIRATERALSESEQKFRSITTSALDAIIMVDEEGKAVFFNKAAEQMFGYTAEEMMGKDLHQLLSPSNYLDDYRRAYAHFAKTGEGAAIGKVLEMGALRKDGSEFPIELSVSALYIKDKWNAVGIIRDITARKQVEASVERLKRDLELILKAVGEGICTMDLNGNHIQVNPAAAKMLGYEVEEMIGHPSHSLWHYAKADGTPYPEEQCLITATMRDGVIRRSESEVFWRKDGTSFPVEYINAPIRSNGDIVGAVVVFHDITERKQMEGEIRKLNEALELMVQQRTQQLLQAQEGLVRSEKLATLGQVAGSVGHELRNPLGVMSNAVYFLQTVLADADETTREYLSIIKNEITNSERIVSDLLDSVRTTPPRPQTISVAELIRQTLDRLVIPPSITVKQEFPATLPNIRVDPLQIHQVLRNLITNGVEAMPDGGMLKIGAVANADEGTVRISVQDSGTGMSPEHLTKLFQPLFTTKARGIGLGLVVVKNLTQANGGNVEVESELGSGTTFFITLPSE